MMVVYLGLEFNDSGHGPVFGTALGPNLNLVSVSVNLDHGRSSVFGKSLGLDLNSVLVLVNLNQSSVWSPRLNLIYVNYE